MASSIANPERLRPEVPEEGISHAKAHLLAEGSHWIATGEVYHDESEPMGRVLARLDDLVPSAQHFDWLTTSKVELEGYAPMDFIDADQLKPIEDLLDMMEEQSGSFACSDNAAA